MLAGAAHAPSGTRVCHSLHGAQHSRVSHPGAQAPTPLGM